MLGIGSTMLFTAMSLIGQFADSEDENLFALSLVTYYNQTAPLFLLLGLFSLVIAFIIPMILLNSKSKTITKQETCNCGTVLRCPTHDT